MLQDLFLHNAWAVRVKGMDASDSERTKQVDFSKFYERFGYGGDEEGGGEQEGAGAAAGAAAGEQQQREGGARGGQR